MSFAGRTGHIFIEVIFFMERFIWNDWSMRARDQVLEFVVYLGSVPNNAEATQSINNQPSAANQSKIDPPGDGGSISNWPD